VLHAVAGSNGDGRYRADVGSKTRSRCFEQATLPLRRGSVELLQSELSRYLAIAGPEIEIDVRDVLVGLAPYHDCAVRLGADPVAVFDAASSGLPDAIRELAMEFARRNDITLDAFGWTLRELPDGPCYEPAERTSWMRGSRELRPR
jgi:hypothetical protein